MGDEAEERYRSEIVRLRREATRMRFALACVLREAGGTLEIRRQTMDSIHPDADVVVAGGFGGDVVVSLHVVSLHEPAANRRTGFDPGDASD